MGVFFYNLSLLSLIFTTFVMNKYEYGIIATTNMG